MLLDAISITWGDAVDGQNQANKEYCECTVEAQDWHCDVVLVYPDVYAICMASPSLVELLLPKIE